MVNDEVENPILLDSKTGAKFYLRYALLEAPNAQDDKDPYLIGAVLHELSHAVTLMGSRYYAYCAAQWLHGDKPISRSAFLEAVPSAFKELGGRHHPGTLPQESLINDLVNACLHYRDVFKRILPDDASADNYHPGTAGGYAGLSGRELFDRSLVVHMVRAALCTSEPEKVPSAFVEYLSRRGPIPDPAYPPGSEEHIVQLIKASGFSLSKSMFPNEKECRDILNYALGDSSVEESLCAHILLIPALIGVECLMYLWDTEWDLSVFRSPSFDMALAATQWVHRMGEASQITSAVLVLLRVLAPNHNGRMLVPAQHVAESRQTADFLVRERLTQLVVALPGVVRSATNGGCEPSVYARLDELSDKVSDVVESFIHCVQQNVKPRSVPSKQHPRFYPRIDLNGESVLEFDFDREE